MIFERKKYLDELIAGRGNGLVKQFSKKNVSVSDYILTFAILTNEF